MLLLIIGLLLFFFPHSIAIIAWRWRERMQLYVGLGAWKGVYSLFSLAGLLLIIIGFGHARHTPVWLYVPPYWMHYLTYALMLPVFPLLLAAYLPGNIQTAARHPMLAAVKIWATAHLLSNGTLADVLIFGSFLIWAIFDRISLKYRPHVPTPGAPATRYNDAIVVVLGLALYVLTLWRLHALLIGVALL